MNFSVPDNILAIKPYTPGKPLEEVEREYGISGSIKLASNENPLGASPLALKAIRAALDGLNRYPDGGGYNLVNKISERFGIEPGSIVLGNGSDDIIGMLARAFLGPGDEVVLPTPTFLMYNIMVRISGATSVPVPLRSLKIDLDAICEEITSKTKMIFICNPNNPTGTGISGDAFERFLKKLPDQIIVVMDEAYIEFIRDKNIANSLSYFGQKRNIVALRTFSKVYGLAGLRIGYGLMSKEIAQILNRVRQPFNANSLAQVGAKAALDDDVFLSKTINLVHEGLDFLYDSLDQLKLEYFPTQTNFFLINVRKKAADVFERLLSMGVIVRDMTSYGYPEYIRINVGLPEENARFIEALKEVL